MIKLNRVFNDCRRALVFMFFSIFLALFSSQAISSLPYLCRNCDSLDSCISGGLTTGYVYCVLISTPDGIMCFGVGSCVYA